MSNSNVLQQDFSEIIERIRRSFLSVYENDKDAFDEIDVSRIRNERWVIERHILDRKGNEKDAFENLVNTMKWRKSFGVNRLKATDFPQEFWEIGEAHLYVADKNGVKPAYIRVKFHKQLSDWLEISKKFVVYLMETLDKETNGKNWSIIWDCDGGTLFNVDIELLVFCITTCFRYYPKGAKYYLLHELPFVLWGIYQLGRTFIPEHYRNTICFSTRRNIADLIGIESLPDYLGGECNKKYRGPIEGAPGIEEVAKDNDLNENAVKKFFSHYQSFLDEAREKQPLNDEPGK
ncbi:motile sperm domain-containing protein 2-like protein [Dinothrombium tinctorium]|uniref:Motile sperm domain-containing protein 2-like protein n=1 Tax=Dinothrombium tinctorium TaxID=1965070 RepID=A0A443R9Z1_9ACAR|nr:motile sperm domain-containing protein 2-like protein [Dinothrombium tinctorium]